MSKSKALYNLVSELSNSEDTLTSQAVLARGKATKNDNKYLQHMEDSTRGYDQKFKEFMTEGCETTQ